MAATEFTHSRAAGPIDYTAQDSTVNLGSDPMVIFEEESNPLVTFTPLAPSVTAYDPADASKAVAVSIPQSWWDLWFFSAGEATIWLRDLDDVLSVSITPSLGSKIWDARVFLRVVREAKGECLKGKDPRVQLEESGCFLHQKYARNQPTAKHAYGAKNSWMALLVEENTAPMARLGFVLRPRSLV